MTTRAIMKGLNAVELVDDTTYVLTFDWHVLDNTGGISGGTTTAVTLLWSDTLAQMQAKIIDAIVANTAAMGLTLARTNTLLISYGRGT